MHSIHEGGVLLFFLTGKLPWRAVSGLSRSRNRSCVNYFLFSGLTATTNSQQWLLLRFLSFADQNCSSSMRFQTRKGSNGVLWACACNVWSWNEASYLQSRTNSYTEKRFGREIAQDVKTEKSSQTSKSESFGLNLGFQNSGIPSFGVNYQKVKINEQRQESHHQVNIAINIPSDCDEGCKKHADKVFQLANNALYSDAKQKRLNWRNL